MLFAEMLGDLSFEQIKRMQPILEDYAGFCRVAIMDHAGEVLMLNQKEWEQDEGVWYSNDSYKPWVPRVWTGRAGSKYLVSGVIDEDWDPSWDDRSWDKEVGAYTAGKYEKMSLVDTVVAEERTPLDPELKGYDNASCYQWYGFEWDQGILYRANEDGALVHDEDLEDAVLQVWFSEMQKEDWPDSEDEWLAINKITADLIEAEEVHA